MKKVGYITEDKPIVQPEFGVYVSNVELFQSFEYSRQNKITIELRLDREDFKYVSEILMETQKTKSRLGLKILP